jgi:DNA-3-methyladenine glycosylase I
MVFTGVTGFGLAVPDSAAAAGRVIDLAPRRRDDNGRDRPPRLDHGTLAGLGSTAASKALSKDLKRRGWRFVGPTTVYAFMQAMGLVNDHLEGCWVREEVEAARQLLRRPGSTPDTAP